MKNEPAFPIVTGDRMWDEGMTLRDYFAAHALIGLLPRQGGHEVAALAYGYADDMLKHREIDTLCQKAEGGNQGNQ